MSHQIHTNKELEINMSHTKSEAEQKLKNTIELKILLEGLKNRIGKRMNQ